MNSTVIIQSTDLHSWADRIIARRLLPVLIRRLITNSPAEILSSNFPGYDRSEDRGWDGELLARSDFEQIPNGKSYWEFGVNKNPKEKANSDYKKRTNGTDEQTRQSSTFVFVTPRNWKNAEQWANYRLKEGKWKNVVALDASHLEQWIERSIATQVWFAGVLGLPTGNVETLDEFYSAWRKSTTTPISPKIFSSAIEKYKDNFLTWLEKGSEKPVVVTAFSKKEALAFLAALFNSVPELEVLSDKALLLKDEETTKRLSKLSMDFIPITTTSAAEKAVQSSFEGKLSISVYGQSRPGLQADVALTLPTHEDFRNALKEMGSTEADIIRLGSESHRSPTILHRILAKAPSDRFAIWADNQEYRKFIVPLLLTGRWQRENEIDQEILITLSTTDSYEEVENTLQQLASLEDSPVWIEATHAGVVSKLDALHASARFVTKKQIGNFIEVAELILSEEDPSLDLDLDERWMASLKGKTREISSTLLTSICDTLAFLSVHGDHLLSEIVGIDISAQVSALVKRLLKDQPHKKWQSLADYLPYFAEAAPDSFLSILEHETLKETSGVEALFESSGQDYFTKIYRSGLLWALELLAWDKKYLVRASRLLAYLCNYKVRDNYSNTPLQSLNDIFLSWRPHTDADLEVRESCLEVICKHYPDVGWSICMNQVNRQQITSGTHRPHWRSVEDRYSKGMSRAEHSTFLRKCQTLLLTWPGFRFRQLADLTPHLMRMDEGSFDKYLSHFQTWLNNAPDDDQRKQVLDLLRTGPLSSRWAARNEGKYERINIIQSLANKLIPMDLIQKHQWLFEKHWVDLPVSEYQHSDFEVEKHTEKVRELRLAALMEIYTEYGAEGIVRLIDGGEGGYSAGWLLSEALETDKEKSDLIAFILNSSLYARNHSIEAIVRGLFQREIEGLEESLLLDTFLSEQSRDDSDQDKLALGLSLAGFSPPVLSVVKNQGFEVQDIFWQNVRPYFIELSDEHFNYVADNLIKRNRFTDAFTLIEHYSEKVSAGILIRLLSGLVEISNKNEEPKKLSSHSIQELFNALIKKSGDSSEDLARLEFQYAQLLSRQDRYGFPALSKRLYESPGEYFLLIARCFRRSDKVDDSATWGFDEYPERRPELAKIDWIVLENIDILPVLQKTERSLERRRENLVQWISSVCKLAEENKRHAVTEQLIGSMLAKSLLKSDQSWREEVPTYALEMFKSVDMAKGFAMAIFNSRGVHERPDHGNPERSLAEKYKSIAEEVLHEFPFVTSILLKIANDYERDAKKYDQEGKLSKWDIY